MRPVIRVLDLCCGYQSVRRAVEEMFGATHDVRYVGVDCERKLRPTVCADLRTWDWRAELCRRGLERLYCVYYN